VWVRNGSTLGIVPLHPGDKPGKTAQNLNQGIFPVQNSQIAHSTVAAGTEKWSVLKSGPAGVISSSLAVSASPSRVSRTIVDGVAGSRVVTLGRTSSISYDPHEHRYVNSGNPPPNSTTPRNANEVHTEATRTNRMQPASNMNNGAAAQGAVSTRLPARLGTPGAPAVPQAPATASARAAAPPRAPAVPAPARSGGGSSASGGSFASGGSSWGGGSRGGGASPGSSAGAAGHPSSTGGGGGGHPH
jgi:hypothetical protein